MNSPLRLFLHALGAMVLALVVLAVPAPAGATITRLCTGYSSCANAGMSSGGYASVSGQMYWRMYSGHNCTNYAAYRVIRNGYSSTRPWDGSGNATYWGTQMASITDRTPRVGAIAWWRAGVYPAGSAGHVAYVERVISPTEIIVSQDSWGGDFSWARITSTSGWPSGFIHFNDRAAETALKNVKDPVISGDTTVGSTLSATGGEWRPGDPSLVFEWRSGGAAVQTGSSNKLQLTRDVVGQRVKVKVTARKSGYTEAVARSERTARVRLPLLTSTRLPAVIGDPQVGQTLSTDGGRWTPRADSKAFQWRADGQPLAGATTRQLAVTSALVGKSLSVSVTAGRDGYRQVTTTSAGTAPVTAPPVVVQQEPVMEGTPLLGETLRLTTVGTSTTPQATRSLQWLRDGQPVRGATTRRYDLTRDDLGTLRHRPGDLEPPGLPTGSSSRHPPPPLVRSVPSLEHEVAEGTGRFVVTATVPRPRGRRGAGRRPGRPAR